LISLETLIIPAKAPAEQRKHLVADSSEFFLSFCMDFTVITDYFAQYMLLILIVNNQHVKYFIGIGYIWYQQFHAAVNNLIIICLHQYFFKYYERQKNS